MDRRVTVVLALIEHHPDAAIDTLAAAVNLSPSRLGHLFKTETGSPLRRHVASCRLAHAEILLKTTFLSIKQVAAAAGFRDANYFIRRFRQAFAVTPGTYRRTAVLDSK